MSITDKTAIIMMFNFLVRLLFNILYAVSDRKDDKLWEMKEAVSAQLEEWRIGRFTPP